MDSELEAQWKLRNLQVDTSVKVISVVGVLIAAIVAWCNITYQQQQFRIHEELEENRRQTEFDQRRRQIADDEKVAARQEEAPHLNVSISPRVVADDAEVPIMIIDVSLENVGRVPVRAGERSTGKGCELTVIEYDDYTNVRAEKQQVIDWFSSTNDKYIVKKYNLLRYYTSYPTGGYVIHAGVKYHETAAVPVRKGKLYGVRVRFFTKEWTNADFTYVYVPSE